ncbi:carboxypeptidase B2 [Lampris incognitus]|uniref:carboxypeptidase B2 n=1 Tax=Lampris incognitus TaxID=2546036 RepID=UPI0024B57A02|nr:carboxypeptidase B2 [Lampris incognitus]
MKALLVLLVLTSVDELFRTGGCTSHDRVLSITPRTQDQVDVLKNLSTHYEAVLWRPVSPSLIKEGNLVHLMVPSKTSDAVMGVLKEHSIKHQVLLRNGEALIEMQKRNDSTYMRSPSSNNERYHSLEDIYHWINRTTQEHPDMVKAILIGSSFEKRPIYIMKVTSKKRNEGNRAMWLDCGIHAREWITPAFCMRFVQNALAHYNINQEITNILDNMDVYVLPVMNPDGYKYTWTTNRMWRKNRSFSENSSCVGVDLNRNFDANWCTEGASDDPCSEIYCGQYPESEPESAAVAKFLRSHKESIKLYFTIHSYSQMLLFPYSYTYDKTENHNDLLAMAHEAATRIRRHYHNTYTYGAGANTIYLAPGGSDDWAYNLGIKYSFTLEMQDRGRYGFLLPPSLIHRACDEALLAVKTITTRVIEKTQEPL